MIRYLSLLTSTLLAGCTLQPRLAETVWVTVARIYTPEDLQKSWNTALASRAQAAALSDGDIAAGRLVRVACGLGTDYTWGGYGYLPAGMNVRVNEVLKLRIDNPSEASRSGWNPIVGRVEQFTFPGSSRAYAYVPDWKERGLSASFEQIALKPEQRGRYVISHSEYVIKCRQDDEYHSVDVRH